MYNNYLHTKVCERTITSGRIPRRKSGLTVSTHVTTDDCNLSQTNKYLAEYSD